MAHGEGPFCHNSPFTVAPVRKDEIFKLPPTAVQERPFLRRVGPGDDTGLTLTRITPGPVYDNDREEMNDLQLLDAIPRGQENRITRGELMEITGLSDRILRQELHKLRASGEVICSSTVPPGGYWKPADAEETAAFVASMHHRARATFAAATSASRALKAGGHEAEEA